MMLSPGPGGMPKTILQSVGKVVGDSAGAINSQIQEKIRSSHDITIDFEQLTIILDDAVEDIKEIDKKLKKHRESKLTEEEKRKIREKEEKQKQDRRALGEYNSHMKSINMMMLRAIAVASNAFLIDQGLKDKYFGVAGILNKLTQDKNEGKISQEDFDLEYKRLEGKYPPLASQWEVISLNSNREKDLQFELFADMIDITKPISEMVKAGKIPTAKDLEEVNNKLESIRKNMVEHDKKILEFDKEIIKIESEFPELPKDYNELYRSQDSIPTANYEERLEPIIITDKYLLA